MMRIAHFSDLHVLDWEGVGPARFLNKRMTGWVNIRLKRGHIHRSQYVRAISERLATVAAHRLPFYVMPKYSGTLRTLMNSGIAADRVLRPFDQSLS